MVVAAFVAPYLLEATVRFAEAAARLPGVRVALVTQEDKDAIPSALRVAADAYWRVEDALDPVQIAAAVRGLSGQLGPVDRVFGALEQLQVPLAQAREILGLSGMDVATARNFRDKSRMKTVLQAAGVPCARHLLAASPGEAAAFVHQVGFPVVVKPPAGAGSKSTFRMKSEDDLRAWLGTAPPTPEAPVLVEEFLTGEEHSLESVAIDGQVVWQSISRYFPAPLEVVEKPWLQWAVLLPRDISGPEYAAIHQVGPAALRALGLRTGLTHMEWFRRPDGSAAVSEVGARPPGAQFVTLLSYAHEVDFYTAWARLMIFDAFEPPERRWAVGVAYVRGQGSGRVVAVHGVEELHREVGHLVVEARLPRIGAVPSGTYDGDGWVIVRHADTAVVTEALRRLVSGIRVELG